MKLNLVIAGIVAAAIAIGAASFVKNARYQEEKKRLLDQRYTP